MSCKQIKPLIIDHVDGTLDELQNQAVLSHIKNCRQCKNRINEEYSLQRTLKSLSEIKAPENFHHTVFAGISEKHSHKTSYFAGFSSAIAASLMLWLVFFPTQEMKSINKPIHNITQQPGIEITLNDIENIRLSFDAPDNFKKVTLSVELPEQVEIEGFPDKRHISWETSLAAGTNILTLPVIARSVGESVIKAKISTKQKNKVFEIRMLAIPGKQASLAIET